MNRRRWIFVAGSAGLVGLLPGCASFAGLAGRGESKVDAKAAERLGGDCYEIWQGGRWMSGRNAGRRMPSFSITKSFAALAVVRAVGEGWLDLDLPLAETWISEWKGDAAKRQVTVRMLVNQTAGFPSGVAALYRGKIQDKGKVAVALSLVDPPGERFRYGPASSEILAEVLRRGLNARHGVSGSGSSLETFLRDLMRKTGISSPEWRKDGSGTFYLSTGAEFSARDLARLGQVVVDLAQGQNAAGLKGTVFKDLATPRAANPMVSAGIWWNRNAGKSGAFAIEPERQLDGVRTPSFWQRACLAPDLDPGWLAMVGSGGKRVYVLPSRELVVVRLGRSGSWNDGAFLRAITA